MCLRDCPIVCFHPSPGGALFGDDYTQGSAGVAEAVKDGAAQLGASFRVHGRYWIMERTVRE